MYTKLTRSELKIIEQTKKEGEEFYGNDVPENDEASHLTEGQDISKRVKHKKPSKIKPYIFLILIFILLAFVAKVAITLLS